MKKQPFYACFIKITPFCKFANLFKASKELQIWSSNFLKYFYNIQNIFTMSQSDMLSHVDNEQVSLPVCLISGLGRSAFHLLYQSLPQPPTSVCLHEHLGSQRRRTLTTLYTTSWRVGIQDIVCRIVSLFSWNSVLSADGYSSFRGVLNVHPGWLHTSAHCLFRVGGEFRSCDQQCVDEMY